MLKWWCWNKMVLTILDDQSLAPTNGPKLITLGMLIKQQEDSWVWLLQGLLPSQMVSQIDGEQHIFHHKYWPKLSQPTNTLGPHFVPLGRLDSAIWGVAIHPPSPSPTMTKTRDPKPPQNSSFLPGSWCKFDSPTDTNHQWLHKAPAACARGIGGSILWGRAMFSCWKNAVS